LPGIFELAPFVVTQEQGAEADAAPGRIGEATDHEFLFIDALELQPIGGTAMRVRALPPFRDQPLETLLARLSIKGFALRVPVNHESQGRPKVEHPLEQILSMLESDPGEVEPIEIDQVKDVVKDRDAAPAGLLGVFDADPALELRKAGAVAFEGDHLAIDHPVMLGLGFERLSDLRERVVQVLLVARQESDGPGAPERETSLAIQLVLKDPVRI